MIKVLLNIECDDFKNINLFTDLKKNVRRAIGLLVNVNIKSIIHLPNVDMVFCKTNINNYYNLPGHIRAIITNCQPQKSIITFCRARREKLLQFAGARQLLQFARFWRSGCRNTSGCLRVLKCEIPPNTSSTCCSNISGIQKHQKVKKWFLSVIKYCQPTTDSGGLAICNNWRDATFHGEQMKFSNRSHTSKLQPIALRLTYVMVPCIERLYLVGLGCISYSVLQT